MKTEEKVKCPYEKKCGGSDVCSSDLKRKNVAVVNTRESHMKNS